MLIKLKKERTHQEDRRLALWLATSAGLLNAIALGAFGFFPSHMTGNTSQLSSEVSSTDLSDIIFFGSIILSFVAGAIIARTIVIWGIIHNVRLVFCQILFVEGLLLSGVSFYEMYFHALTSNREIILFLCGLMGIHNSTSTQLSGGRVRSTHITGTLTDAEKEYLPWGAKLMTLECGIRFLTDYLEGDTYFKIHRDGQNLDRCRTQFKLVRDMEARWDEMAAVVKKYS